MALSDYHEMFYVDELFKDFKKFNAMLDELWQVENPIVSHRLRTPKASLAQSQKQTSIKTVQEIEEEKKSGEEGNEELVQEVSDEEIKDIESEDDELEEEENNEDSSEESDDDTLTMSRVRFNSLCILPSQIDSCSIENYHKDQNK